MSAPTTIANVTAVISEVAEELRECGKQDLAARLIAAGAGVSVGTDAPVVRALVTSLAEECRAASVILQEALAVLSPAQQHALAQRVDRKGLIGAQGGTTRHFDRRCAVARAEQFLYVTNEPGVLH